jgi:AbrB family looped-hinge helix DNA binding protein
MAKVTSKLEVTVPKPIADQLGIRPGDEVEFLPGDDGSLRILLLPEKLSDRVEDRLRSFDEATRRRCEREKRQPPKDPATDRGWTREELYDRGRLD